MVSSKTGDSGTIGFVGQTALVMASLPAVLGIYVFGLVLPQIATEFSANPNSVLLSQLVGTIVGFTFAISAPVIGGLITRFGYREVFLWSAIGFSLAGSSVFVLHDLYLILLTRVVVGICVAGVLVASLAGIGTLPEGVRAKLFGYQAFLGASFSLPAYFLVGELAHHGWRMAFSLHLLGLVIAPLILTLPRHRHVAVAAAAPKGGLLHGLSPALLLMSMFMGMASIMPGTFAPFFMVHLGITDTALIAIPLMVCAATAMPSAFGYGFLVGRIGIARVFLISSLLVGVGLVASGQSQSLVMLSVSLGIVGFGAALYTPNMNSAAVAQSPLDAARAIGLANGVLYGSQALFPFIVAGITKFAGPIAVFQGFGACALLIAGFYAFRSLTGRDAPGAAGFQVAHGHGVPAPRTAEPGLSAD